MTLICTGGYLIFFVYKYEPDLIKLSDDRNLLSTWTPPKKKKRY